MKRPILFDPTFDLNVPAKSPRVSFQSPFHGSQNSVPMPDSVLPYYPPTREAEENTLTQEMAPNLELFWHQQLNEMNNITGFKGLNHLPLARVKKIMKSDPEVKMISADTPPVFAKACEMFIQEMTLRAWMQTESCNRCTIQRCDIAEAIKHKEIFDFLVGTVPFGLHCVHHQGVDVNAMQEQAAPPAADQPDFSLLDMNVPVNLNHTEQCLHQNLEVPPEVMADSFVAHEAFDLNFALP